MSQRRKIEREVSLGRLPESVLDLPSHMTMEQVRDHVKRSLTVEEKAEVRALIEEIKGDPNGANAAPAHPIEAATLVPEPEVIKPKRGRKKKAAA